MQDDYLGCFGDSVAMGKIGTDIQEGKCTWLLVVALQRANAQQKATLEVKKRTANKRFQLFCSGMFDKLIDCLLVGMLWPS